MRPLPLLVTTTAALLVPATADAATRYVDKTGADNATCPAAAPCLNINHAVSVANADDTIDIGPGSYDEAVVADAPLHFQGSGAGSYDSLLTPGTTRIQPIANDGPALEMREGGSARDLQLVGKAGPGPANRPGLLLAPNAAGASLEYEVERVHAFGGQTGSGSRRESIRVDDAGQGRELNAHLAHLNLAPGALDDGGDGLVVDGSDATATLDHVTIRPLSDSVRFPVWLQNGGQAAIERSTMVPTGKVNAGVFVDDAPGFARVENSDLRANGRVALVSNGVGPQSAFFNAKDSVLANVSSAPTDPAVIPAISAQNFAGGRAIVGLKGTTVLARRARAEGVFALSAGTGLVSVTARNTIVRATTTTGQDDTDVHLNPGNGPNDFEATNSQYAEALVDAPSGAGSGTATAPGSEGNVTADPGLVDEAGGDLRLGNTSPLVDRGDPALVTPAQLDVAGRPRSIDGDGDGSAVPDIGAYERDFVPGSGGHGDAGGGASGTGATGTAGGAGAGTGASSAAAGPTAVRILRFGLSRTRFAVARKRTALTARRTPRGTAFAFELSAPASAKIAIARQVRTRKHRKRLKPVGTLTRNAAAGATSVPFSGRLGRRALRPGSYVATLSAGGATKAAAFRVVKRKRR